MSDRVQLARAHELMRRGKLPEAEAVCRRIVGNSPDDAEGLQLLGLIRRQAGDLDAAEQLLQASLHLAPNRADYHTNLGNLLRARGRLADAEFCYRSALAVDDDFRLARLGLARLLNDASLHGPAESEAHRLIGSNARDAEAWSVLGTSLRGQGKFADAEAAFRQALAITPGYAAARHNLGALLGQLERAEESLAELDRAAAAGVRGREIAFNRGRALMDLARLDEAEQAFATALAADPTHVESQVTLAKLRYMRGDPEFARGFALGERAQPRNVRLRLAHGDVLRRSGDAAASERILRGLLQDEGPIPEVTAALAIVLHEQGKLNDALLQARAARDARPDNPALDEGLVGVLLSLGDAREALPLILRQRLLQPLDQRWLAYEASALRLLGDARYRELYDYARFVRQFELTPPAGWSSIAAFNADLIESLKRLHRYETHPLDQSLRLGTQTPRSLLVEPDPVIGAFLKAVEAPIAEYRAVLGREESHPLLCRNSGPTRIVGCWSVRLRRGGYHVNHVHPEGWISSAYYVEVPSEVADAERRSGWIKFGEPRMPVPGATPEHFVQPQAGRLVLFPSYMWHGTTPIIGDAPRMTVPFDAVPGDA